MSVAQRRIGRICQAISPVPVAAAPAARKVLMLQPGSSEDRKQMEEQLRYHGMEAVYPENKPSDVWAIVTTDAPVTAELLKSAGKDLKLVAVSFTGYNHVDLSACAVRAITVVHCPSYSTNATAELALGLSIAVLRRIPEGMKTIQGGGFNIPGPSGEEIGGEPGKVVGILGTGRIGMRVAELLQPFKPCRVIGVDKERSSAFEAVGGTYVDSLATLFIEADIVYVCVSLERSTRHLVSRELLELMKPKAVLINVSRGGVVDQEALIEHLAAGRIRAGLDVYDATPGNELALDAKLRALPDSTVVLSAHAGHKTVNAIKNRWHTTLANLCAFRAGHPQNVVLDGSEDKKLYRDHHSGAFYSTALQRI